MPLDTKTESAIRAAITKLWSEKSDLEFAAAFNVPVSVIEKMREDLGFKRESLKEFARRYLLNLPEKEKQTFMKNLPAELIWKMAEGNPHSTVDETHKILPTPIMSFDEVPPAPQLPPGS